MDDDLLDETNPPATKRKGEFGAIQVPTNKQEFQQWTAGLDRESVREALLHFQALNEQHERGDHPRQAEAMERRVGDGWTVVCSKKRLNKKRLKGKKDFGEGGFFNSGKEKGSEKEGKEEGFCRERRYKRSIFLDDRSLRSGPKSVSPEKTPLSFCCAGPTQLNLVLLWQVPVSKMASISLKDAQNNQEEPVMGDTPPGPGSAGFFV